MKTNNTKQLEGVKMNRYKIAFWGLMLVVYALMFCVGLSGASSATDYMIFMLVYHIALVTILAFAWLVGYLFDKAYG